jgi:hypothetical protein
MRSPVKNRRGVLHLLNARNSWNPLKTIKAMTNRLKTTAATAKAVPVLRDSTQSCSGLQVDCESLDWFLAIDLEQ